MGRYATRTLTDEEYRKIVLLMRTGYIHNNVKHRPNDQIATILVLQANLGCRIGDIMALTTESIVKDGGIYRLNITEQKTNKARYFIVPEPIKAFIDDYCRCSGIKQGNLFDIKSPAVWKQLRAVTYYLGYENVSCHSFRKKFACDIYERSNHDIELVRATLQHSSTSITQAYIKRSDAQVEAALLANVSIA